MDHLYVAEGHGGLLKIGHSTNPTVREISLRKEFIKRGDRITRFIACSPVEAATGIEWTLQECMSKLSPRQSGREWFVKGDFETALETARLLTDEQAQKEALARTPKGRAEQAKYAAKTAKCRIDAAESNRNSRINRAAFRAAVQQRRAERECRTVGAFAAMVGFLAPSLTPATTGAVNA